MDTGRFILLLSTLVLTVHTQTDMTTSPPPDVTTAQDDTTTAAQQGTATATGTATHTSATTERQETTPATTTQQQQATSTAVPPLSEAVSVEAYDVCTCDLTGGACDVECCCDADCSAQALGMFSGCHADYLPPWDDNYCYRHLPMVFTNTEYYNVTRTSAGLFCIVIDNYKDRKEYEDISAARSEMDFTHLESSVDGVSEDSGYDSELDKFLSVYGDGSGDVNYQSGDPLVVRYAGSGLCDTLRLPSVGAVTADSCSGWGRGARLLRDDHWACTRVLHSQALPNMAASCTSDDTLAADTYYAKVEVLSSPAYITTSPAVAAPSNNISKPLLVDNSTDDTTPLMSGECAAPQDRFISVTERIHCEQSDGRRLPVESDRRESDLCDAVKPSVVGSECRGVVHSVMYEITVSSSGVLTNVTADIHTRNVPLTATHIRQHFSYHFTWLENTDSTAPAEEGRSGNPGYIVGKPVIMGRVEVVEGSGMEQMQAMPPLSLLVSRGTASRCSSQHERHRVGFGIDTLSGCLLEVDAATFGSSCDRIQQDVLGYLLGGGNQSVEGVHAAVYGNSKLNDSVASHWVPVLVENMPDPSSDPATPQPAPVCERLTLGLHINVLYANIGSVEMPQSKIVGVRFEFAAARRVQLRCVGVQCSGEGGRYTELVEVSSAVSFTDVSQSPLTIQARMPRLETKLPYDFFYPFFLSHATTTTAAAHSSILTAHFFAIIITTRITLLL